VSETFSKRVGSVANKPVNFAQACLQTTSGVGVYF